MSWIGSSGSDAQKVVAALDRSLALIQFTPSGVILSANQHFCSALGYSEAEIRGKHHRIFVMPDEARSPEYSEFWARLARGEYEVREYKRIGKGGREVWIQASYNPVTDARGVVVKVIKVATEITEQKQRNADFESKMIAIDRAQAIIEFNTAGEVIHANANFLDVMGYRIEEVRGKHHRMFVSNDEARSQSYRDFWAALNNGDFVAREFKRVGKGGKVVWISASYNPVFDSNRRIVKIVKFATDVTERVRAMNDIADGLARLSQKDIEACIEREFPHEFEPVRQSFNVTSTSLRMTFRQMVESVVQVRSVASGLTVSARDLSLRTEEQSVSLEETASTLDEITATVRRSAEGAEHARVIVEGADRDAKAATDVVREAISAMDGISQSSDQIGRIIGVIDEIAFQTNLLALNAGVEAARAGDAGRGFAVVATEVRALAQRSADAAKEIKALVSESASQVAAGVGRVAATGSSLERILAQVNEINGVMAGIAAGAREQSVALAAVNASMNRMDQVTQANAAMVERTSAATISLANETESLSRLIGAFRVGNEPAGEESERAAGPESPVARRRSRGVQDAGAGVRQMQAHLQDAMSER